MDDPRDELSHSGQGLFARGTRCTRAGRITPSRLWTRADAQSPWVLDVLLTPTETTATGDMWTFKRNRRVRLPLTEAVRPGPIPHLAPLMVLLHKGHLCRPEDNEDLEATLPLLNDQEP